MNTKNYRVTTDVYASKEKRFANFIIDYAGYYIFTFIVGILLGILAILGVEGPLMYLDTMGLVGEYAFTISIYLVYYVSMEAIFQKSFGKFITKTKVIMEDGSKPTTKDIIIRSLCRLIPFEAFSFLGDLGRGWHDSMSDTYVVDIKKYDSKRTTELELEMIGKSDIDLS